MPNDIEEKIISNEIINENKVKIATKIIRELQSEIKKYTQNGSGPFIAAIYDSRNNLIAKSANSVIKDNCSSSHAEINAIKLAEEKFNNYDLSSYNLSLYVTAEPCTMCIGAIMWSGIKNVYYGVKTTDVEKITGFDEGFKPNWFEEFKKRGITVYGNIASKEGQSELQNYVKEHKIIYKPTR